MALVFAKLDFRQAFQSQDPQDLSVTQSTKGFSEICPLGLPNLLELLGFLFGVVKAGISLNLQSSCLSLWSSGITG